MEDIIKELKDWIYKNEKPSGEKETYGWKTLSAHYLLKHIEKHYNISKKTDS
jgi:hypothetical protein